MPKIRTIDPRGVGLGSQPIPKQRASSIGGGIEALGKSVTGVGDLLMRRAEQAEISDLNAKLSEVHVNQTAQWQETLRTSDGNDPDLAQKFITGFKEQIAVIGQDTNTNAGNIFFQKSSQRMQVHFAETAFAGQAELAGKKARENHAVSLSNYTTALINDPSGFDLALAGNTEAREALVTSGMMKRSKADEFAIIDRSQLAKSAIRGLIRLVPEDANAQLKSGKWDSFIDGDLKKQLFGEADQAIRARTAEEARFRAEQKRATEERQKATNNEFMEAFTTSSLTTTQILESNLNPFGSGSKEQWLRMIRATSKEGITTDTATYVDLFNRIHAEDDDPNRILDENLLNQELINKKLDATDLAFLRKEMQGKNTIKGKREAALKKNIFDAAFSALAKPNKLTGIGDPDGILQYQKWLIQFTEDFDEGRKAGKSAAELLNPDSKNFIGGTIQLYERNIQQKLRSGLRSLRRNVKIPETAAPKPRTGETPDQYLKRIKKVK